MKIETLWIARDPSPTSELADICFEMAPDRLDRYVIGSPTKAWELEHHTLYTTREEAEADALQRLEHRNASTPAHARLDCE